MILVLVEVAKNTNSVADDKKKLEINKITNNKKKKNSNNNSKLFKFLIIHKLV